MVDDDASNSGGSDHSSKPGAAFDDSSKSSAQTNSNGSTTTTGTGNTGAAGTVLPEAILATKETKAVHYSRIIVLAVLGISAAMAGSVAFWLFTESEKGDFKVQVSTFYFVLHYLSFVGF
jgi:H+/Cl- antiporter ClcA